MAGGRTRKQANDPSGISYGYVVIPVNVDRDLYVESCLRRGKVSIMKEGGIFNMDVIITNEALQNIHFPENPGEKGTAVVIAKNPYSGVQIIIGTYCSNDEFPVWSEDVFRFKKIINKTSANLTIDPKNNVVNLTIDSPEDVRLNVCATGSENSKVNIFSTGSVNVKANKKISSIGYTEIESKIINTEKPEEETRSVTMNLEKLEIVRKTEEIDETILIDDVGTSIEIKDDVSMKLTKEDINIKTGTSTLKMNNDIIEFNGGGLKGLVELDNLTSKLNTFVNTFNNHVHNVPAATFLVSATAGVSNPTPIPVMTPAQQAQSFNASDYENEKITQG